MEKLKYLLQGKFIEAGFSNDKALFCLKVLVPKNTAKSYTSDTPIFEEVIIEFSFITAIIGYMNNDTSGITLEDDAIILSSFKNRVFRSDLGTPDYYGVDDVSIPELASVHFECICKNKYELKLIIPESKQMPCIKLVFNEIAIKNLKGKLIGYDSIIEDLSLYYDDHYQNYRDRIDLEWKLFYDLNNSLGFYQNRLGDNSDFNITQNDKLKDLTKPLWIEVENLKYDDLGYIEYFKFVNATKRKSELKGFTNEVIWMAPEEPDSVFTFLSTELFNSDAENPFDEIIELYISKWEPNEVIYTTLIHDLKRLINADKSLSAHSGKSKFFSQLDYWINKRKLVTM